MSIRKGRLNKWNNNLSSYFLNKKSLSEQFSFLIPIMESDDELSNLYRKEFLNGSLDEVNLIKRVVEYLNEIKIKYQEFKQYSEIPL